MTISSNKILFKSTLDWITVYRVHSYTQMFYLKDERWQLKCLINIVAVISLKHDPKIVTTRLNNSFIQTKLRNGSHLKYWSKMLLFFSLSSCLSVIRRQLHNQKQRWDFRGPIDLSTLCRIGDFVMFLHFLFKHLFTSLTFHNTSGCLSKSPEIS